MRAFWWNTGRGNKVCASESFPRGALARIDRSLERQLQLICGWRRWRWHRHVLVNNEPVISALFQNNSVASFRVLLGAVFFQELCTKGGCSPGKVAIPVYTQVFAKRKLSRRIGRKRLRDSVGILRPARIFERSDIEKDVVRFFRIERSGFCRIEVRPGVIEPLQVTSKVEGRRGRLRSGFFLFSLSCQHGPGDERKPNYSREKDDAVFHKSSVLSGFLRRDFPLGKTYIGSPSMSTQGQREDEEIAFAGNDDGEGAAVGRDGEIAEAEAVKDGDGRGLRDRNFMVRGDRRERRKIDPDEIAGFFLEGAFEEDARFVGRPAKDAEANAKTGHAIERREIANFENFLVNEIGDFFAAGRDAEAAFVAIQRCQLLVIITEQVKALQTRGAGEIAIPFNSDSGVRSGQPSDVAKGAAFIKRRNRAGGGARELQGEEQAGLQGFREVSDGGVIGQTDAVGGVRDYAVTFVDADFLAGVIEEKSLEGVFGLAGIVDNGGGEELGENHAAVGRPAEGIDEIAERVIPARVFLAFEETAALAASVLDPDVVVLERVVEFCFDSAIDGIDDAAIGGVGEGGDFLVDGLERLFKVFGFGGRANTSTPE